ncbi:membrane protein [Sphingomonas astaxanthinifaciens DSM 22298]|uniref:Membrane protein n=1 Tax=Sphingomonas astaxanthinifaciens DSM 22298 TaxID=1123267 RepID=A0ABQ5Z609_9SPHN|nr:membrane protein [Sphingomonas astaxanthinifaciens DSM 22298]
MTAAAFIRPTAPARPLDERGWVRLLIALSATLLTAVLVYGLVRWLAGMAPPTPWVRETALAIHLATVIPAMPLGAFVLLTRKGTIRHRWLGGLWLALMLITAGVSIFIRNLNHGSFSPIHLLTLVTLISIPRAWAAARRRDFAAHRRHMLIFYTGSMLIAGFFTFLPGRTMWQWAFA